MNCNYKMKAGPKGKRGATGQHNGGAFNGLVRGGLLRRWQKLRPEDTQDQPHTEAQAELPMLSQHGLAA